MTPDAADWVRTHAWTPPLLRSYDAAGGVDACGCEYGSTAHCRYGDHDLCQAGRGRLWPETYVTDSEGRVCYLPPREAARVWLAPHPCVWACPCDCHQRQEAAAVAAPQSALF